VQTNTSDTTSSYQGSIAFLEAILHTGRPTTVKIASVRYPVRFLVKYLVKTDRVFDKVRPVFKHAFPTPVRLRFLLVTTLDLVRLGKV
jgi:hypothetical protein